MNPHKNLTAKKIEVAALLAAGLSGKRAAEKAGVTAETVSRWRKDPHFSAFLNQLKKNAVEDALVHLRSLNEKAVKTIEKLLDSSSEALRFQVAKFIIAAMILDPKTAQQGIGPTDPTFVKLQAFGLTGAGS